MPKIDLLPCPFCGETDLQLESFSGFGEDVVICRSCLATFSQQEITCKEDLIKAWNTRASGWIPCSVKKPEAYKSVLVVIKDNDRYTWINIGETDEDGNWMIGGEFWYSKSDTSITHWMPLPELPETEGKA
jgi:Lar family restriction alleviation protein